MNIIEFAKKSQAFCDNYGICIKCPANKMKYCNGKPILEAEEKDINEYINLLEASNQKGDEDE